MARLSFCICGLLVSLIAAPSTADIFTVRPDGTGDYATIMEAVTAAQDGDIIELTDGIFSGDGNRDIHMPSREITIRSENLNPHQCVIACEGSALHPHVAFRFSHAGSGATIEGIGITGGFGAVPGGAIRAEDYSNPTIRNCVFMHNESTYGGAIYCRDSSHPSIVRCVFIENSASERGGALDCHLYSDPLIHSCTFYANAAPFGSAIGCRRDSYPEIRNTIICAGQLGEPVYCDQNDPPQLSCCDVFSDSGNDWVGCIAGQDAFRNNFSADPLFCDPIGYDFSLHFESPCAPHNNPACGLVGALPIGCGDSSPGACCFADGSCIVLGPYNCVYDAAGHYAGEGTTCDPNPCPLIEGACCFNTLCFVVTHEDCLAGGGVYLGYGETCDPNPCPVEPGACCHLDHTCSLELLTGCDGLFIGWGVPCDPDPCPTPYGACCSPDGACNLMIEESCEGEYLGHDTLCDPNPCQPVPSACCYVDGSCALTLAEECDGEFQGYGTVCEPNDCAQPLGACCFAHLCFELTELECVDNGGSFMGAFLPCDPNPCEVDDVADDMASIAGDLLLVKPNPSSGSVEVLYASTAMGRVAISIYDVSGREVRSYESSSPFGVVSWDGTATNGLRVAPGSYFVRMDCGRISKMTKLLLIR